MNAEEARSILHWCFGANLNCTDITMKQQTERLVWGVLTYQGTVLEKMLSRNLQEHVTNTTARFTVLKTHCFGYFQLHLHHDVFRNVSLMDTCGKCHFKLVFKRYHHSLSSHTCMYTFYTEETLTKLKPKPSLWSYSNYITTNRSNPEKRTN
jgi:hypothetical protein